ncbi:hypothetical protein [Cardinium endosymbiont of Oedothorax gibbosus]|uniref:hypothetical protein n=1 Tax=Cardinium endosymbiont of Oedothorax gibbosus TaxID=931101 RepID=UPI0020251E98|nr:hypothetical protein [Cardinium endosymbiont of Oedothorax gibbosus]CAH2559940.1 hypothetical protein CAOEGIBSW744_0508 [Cardinium endosymbiont of Oedothorax gibbosus]
MQQTLLLKTNFQDKRAYQCLLIQMVMYMKVINIRKSIPVFFAYFLVAHPSRAVGLTTGPSLGIAGFHTSFDLKLQRQKISTDNMALQVGCFAKLDVWLLYARLDALFVLDWRKLPNKSKRHHFKSITLPLTIGLPLFDLFRPHIGLVFRLPIGVDDARFKGNCLIKSYKEKINGYILGLGIDLGNILMDVYWEFARSPVARKSISDALIDGHKQYRPGQLTLRVGYNLLG